MSPIPYLAPYQAPYLAPHQAPYRTPSDLSDLCALLTQMAETTHSGSGPLSHQHSYGLSKVRLWPAWTRLTSLASRHTEPDPSSSSQSCPIPAPR